MDINRRLPPLLALRAFEAFSRHGLVRDAADEIAISHTVVSRHIQNLEHHLKVKLVRKSGRNLVLTREGETYAAEIRKAFALISSASAVVRAKQRDSLNISCMPSLATQRVLGMLPEIEATTGIKTITLQPQILGSEMLKAGFDVELMYTTSPPQIPGLVARPFAEPRIIPVASPAYLKEHGPVTSFDQLTELTLLHERDAEIWKVWLLKAGVEKLSPLQGPRLWQSNLSLEAARQGKGVALLSLMVARPSIEAGHLVEMLPSNLRLGTYYMLSTEDLWQSPEVRALHEWLIATFAQDC